MNILQINHTDVEGERYNGRRLNQYFQSLGHNVSQCVIIKTSSDDISWQLCNIKPQTRLNLRSAFINIEKYLSIQSLLYPFALELFTDKRFLKADVVHLHLIHVQFFSILLLPLISRLKPTVWTIHDSWPMTGHCVHPNECKRWLEGCGSCPDLDAPFPLIKDHSRFHWYLKKIIYNLSGIDYVVASRFMYNRAKESPLISKHNLHHIPFGINLDVFKKYDQEEAKSIFGIQKDNLVMSFRALKFGGYKGLDIIKAILSRVLSKTKKKICLLTFDQKGLLNEFKTSCNLVELGWVRDEETMANAYNASDIFLMPSQQEAFGMMAVEAMACGKPVVVFEGTALPDTIFAPEGGIAIPMGDVEAFSKKVVELIENKYLREDIGNRASEIVSEHYDFRDHARKILNLYAKVIWDRNN